MTKIEYLKLCIQHKKYSELSWLISILGYISAIPIDKLKHLDLSYELNGYSYLDNQTLVKITDATTQPLFNIKDTITIDSTWLPNVKDPIETTIGKLIANIICVVEPFGANVPYINSKFTVSTIESMIMTKLHSNPEPGQDKKPDIIYVDDYIKLIDNTHYLNSISPIISVSGTPKIITKPTGIEEFTKALIEKYKGKLHDPIALADFEKELKDFDDNYLKDDPGYGIFISGKIKNIARKKLFLGIGAGLDFVEKTKLEPILSTLAEGWNLEPNEFKLMMNDIRYGSFSRGAETVKGGVTFKTLIRATNSFTISLEDCNTKLTLPRTFNSGDIKQLVDRTIVVNDKLITIENIDQAKQYLDKQVNLRSPIYCKSPNDTLCHICCGKKISQHKDNLAILLSEISAIILKASLKIMHGTVLSTAEIDLDKHFS